MERALSYPEARTDWAASYPVDVRRCPNVSSGAFMSNVQYFARGEPFDEGRDLLLVEGLENIVSQAVPEGNLSTTPSETRAPFEVENALEFEYATCKLIKGGPTWRRSLQKCSWVYVRRRVLHRPGT